MLKAWSFDIPPVRNPGLAPAHARIDVAADPRRTRGSVECDYRMDLTVDGEPAGRVTMSVVYLPEKRYSTLRRLHRQGAPALSDDPRVARPVNAPDERTGRRDPRNVLLRNVGDGEAELAAPLDHPAFFDHALDHVPGTAVTEAAAQLALATTGGKVVTGVDARFHRFVELDEPATLTVDGSRVTVVQDGRSAADLVVTTAKEDAR